MERTLGINISENEKCYDIYINNEPIESLYKELLLRTKNQKRLIIFNEKVFSLYSKNLPFPKNEIFILKDGEEQKNLKNYLKIVDKLIKNKMSRRDVIIAIGGGVVGDLAGYVAATYMRGISYIQVPTTLLSMVDSSVGGKTAIDLPKAKNILGCFYQPQSVFINLNFLTTLCDRQFMSGIGEILKYAFIEGNCCFNEPKSLMEFLAINSSRILERDLYFLEKLISICLIYKINVVRADEKEGGLRKVLNLGHTFGHALETLTKYKRYTHGEAVVWGIIIMLKWAVKNCYIDTLYYNSAMELIAKYGFKPFNKKINIDEIIDFMKIDKKSNSGNINLIVPTGARVVSEKEITNVIEFKTWLKETMDNS